MCRLQAFILLDIPYYRKSGFYPFRIREQGRPIFS